LDQAKLQEIELVHCVIQKLSHCLFPFMAALLGTLNTFIQTIAEYI
jgi:hypothetical protein